ncbi:hypothetical protein AgCh_037870 [Apium graveolens]
MFIAEEKCLVVIRFGPDWDETLGMIQSKQPHTEYKGGGEGKEFECLRNELRKMAPVNGRGVSKEVWVRGF